jgi:hypothetical protein
VLYLLILMFLIACVLLIVSGRGILASFPKTLGATKGNLFLFVVGGFAGMFAFPNLLLRTLEFSGIHMTQETDKLFLPAAVVGALAGGTGLVWLKLWFKKSRTDKP